MGELLDRLRQDVLTRWAAPAWHPEHEGDGIEGVLVAMDTRPAEGRRGQAYPVLTLDLDDGRRVAWHAAGQIAAEQIAAQHPWPGDRVAVLYGGMPVSKSGNEFRRWALLVDGPRPRLAARLNAVPDTEHRYRMKHTFARLFGAPLTLAPELIAQADTWLERAIAGTEPLDPAPERKVSGA